MTLGSPLIFQPNKQMELLITDHDWQQYQCFNYNSVKLQTQASGLKWGSRFGQKDDQMGRATEENQWDCRVWPSENLGFAAVVWLKSWFISFLCHIAGLLEDLAIQAFYTSSIGAGQPLQNHFLFCLNNAKRLLWRHVGSDHEKQRHVDLYKIYTASPEKLRSILVPVLCLHMYIFCARNSGINACAILQLTREQWLPPKCEAVKCRTNGPDVRNRHRVRLIRSFTDSFDVVFVSVFFLRRRPG